MRCDECPYEPWGYAGENTVSIEHRTRTEHLVTTEAGKWHSYSILPKESA